MRAELVLIEFVAPAVQRYPTADPDELAAVRGELRAALIAVDAAGVPAERYAALRANLQFLLEMAGA